MSYVELHCASAFSFLEGASRPEDLVSRAKELELPALALVDRDGVYGSARFYMAAKSVGIRAHVGAEISVEGFGNQAKPQFWMPNSFLSRPVRLPLLAENRTGYRNLCRLVTRMKLRAGPKPSQPSATESDFEEFAAAVEAKRAREQERPRWWRSPSTRRASCV